MYFGHLDIGYAEVMSNYQLVHCDNLHQQYRFSSAISEQLAAANAQISCPKDL